jgi:peptidoglycan-associated lipoprotein
MNKILTIGAVSLCVALAGCSGTPKMSGKSSAVPIEERSSSVGGAAGGGVAGTSGAAAGTTAGAATSGVAAGPDAAGAAGGAAAGGASAQPAGTGAAQVETHALAGVSAQGQALGGDGGGAGGAGVQGAAGTQPQGTGNPVTDPRFKDPGNILSKRAVYFDFDSYAIRDEFRELIEAHARYLRDNQNVRAILQGHTDERGSRDYNLALGQRRAESVKQAMALMGVRDEQVEAVSLGEEKPAQEGHDEVAWQLNRRAEIYYQGE